MKLPQSNPRSFILDMRQSLMGSMQQRATDCANWDSLFYAGATRDKDTPAIANIITGSIQTQAGNLFSPDNLTWRIEYELDMDDAILLQATRAASFVSRELRDSDVDLEFSDAVQLGLRHGSCFGSLIWDGEEFACDVITQSSVGVLNEKAKSLDDQPAFMVSYSVPAEEFANIVLKFRGTKEIAKAFDNRDGDAALEMNDATRLVLGLNQPIGSGSSGQAGFISLLPRPPYLPSANSKGRHVAVDAIWLKRDDGRWATVYVVEGNDTIGTDQWRNFMAITPTGDENPILARRHPYWMANPYPVKGAFFGRSAIADIVEAQGFIRRHTMDLDHILDMQANPAHVGYGAIQRGEVYQQALATRNGWVTETGPNAKVQAYLPVMPPQLLEAIEVATGWASDAANRPPVTQGRGEHGVRAGAHADTLMTAASARERRPALRVLRQAGDLGDLALEILRIKDATSLPDGAGGTFTLEALPTGFHVYCNGHTASPLFAAEYNQNADELLKAGAIDAEEYLDMKNPAGVDMLRNALKKRQAQQQKLVESLPPEDRVKLISGGSGHKK
jgi:hypothetical protein